MRELSTELTRAVLEQLGSRVEDIPEAQPEKRADLRAWFGSEEYVVEAKEKGPHGDWSAFMDEVEVEGFSTLSRRIRPWSALSSIVREANEQLSQTPSSAGAFRILAAMAIHDDGEFVVECLSARILGVVQFLPINPVLVEVGQPKPCYYYAHNDFSKLSRLHAALLGTSSGARLFVNSLADGYEAFCQGSLYRTLLQHNAVVDPHTEEARGEALVISKDFTGPRDGLTQARYLLEKYGLRGSIMQEHQFVGLATARPAP